jgi:CHASE2 domain-containing sensor protein
VGKLVILKLGEGSFEQGFPVTLQIGDENSRPVLEITAELPPYPEIPRSYHYWQSIYRNLQLPSRPIGLPKTTTKTPTIEDCHQAATELKVQFNSWLASESFRHLREKLLEKLLPEDNIRILVQTKDVRSQKLPWHLWDLLERYPKAEIAFSAPSYEHINHNFVPKSQVKILAILGNSDGIDTQTDRRILGQLPNADVNFLVEPECQNLTDEIWEKDWQILFFAGHSSSHEKGENGKIYINKTESLTISQLKFALKKAVERGLQLAIFNSCDGLGLAREFADLQIPLIVVMREPVPDKIAQEFLKYFLTAFASGKSIYISAREARERLQGLENQFPCATWLPVIYQNPAAIPLLWQELHTNDTSSITITNLAPSRQHIPDKTRKKQFTRIALLLTSFLTTGLVMGVRFFGLLQPLEIIAFDQLLRSRPKEKPDARILVINITEEDLQAQPQEKRRGSLSDETLAKLLEKISASQPQVIGLDIYRDYSIQKAYPQLAKLIQQNPNFVAVCQVSNPQTGKAGVKPPPEISKENLGFSDIILDADNVVRRHLLALTPPPSSPCTAPYALNVQLALRYLYAQGIQLQFNPDGTWQLGKLTLKPIETHTGGYQGIDALSHQILLNYRSSPTPQAVAANVSLKQVLSGQLSADAIKNRIILIGTTAESFRDYSLTPYKNSQGNQQEIPGVFLQAQMVSQLLSAVLDGRPILTTWSLLHEIIWVWFWSIVGSLIAIYLKRPIYLIFAIATSSISLYLICFSLLIIFGDWIPLIPPLLVLGCSSVIIIFLTNAYTVKQQLIDSIKKDPKHS